jgi:hypothetical protein
VTDEHRLHNNYHIRSFVALHFQDPATQTINGGEVTIFKRMLMAGLRFPFRAIARELLLFLSLAPTQIVPNRWRYVFASFIIWRTVLRAWMTIPEFFNIYRLFAQCDGMVAFQVRQNPNPIFIFMSSS